MGGTKGSILDDRLWMKMKMDAILIGPHDLSCSLGRPEQYDHPQFLEATGEIFRKARARGVGAGIHFWGSIAQQVQFLNAGANMLIHGSDMLLMAQHLREDLQDIRRSMGEEAPEPARGTDVQI